VSSDADARPSEDDVIAFFLRWARAMHERAFPSHHLERVLDELATSLDMPAQFMSLPTSLVAAFGRLTAQRTFIIRANQGDIDLTKQSQLLKVAEEVAAGTLSPAGGTTRVEEIETARAVYPGWLAVAASVALSAAAARLFGGDVAEIAVAAAIGLFVSLEAQLLESTPAVSLYQPIAAVTASFIAAAAGTRVAGLSPAITILGGLIMLMPGFAVTTALDELAARHLVAGTARLTGAVTALLFIGLGVGLGNRLMGLLGVTPPAGSLTALPWAVDLAAVVVGLLAIAVLVRVPARDLPWILIIGGLADLSGRLAGHALDSILAAAVATFVLGLCANLFQRLTGRPNSIALVPGLMLLVPGSLGFRGILSLAERKVVPGVEAAFQMTMIGVALVTGLLLAGVVVPRPSRSV
jgi:uncharacterized membrane protein YjjP (DUF1212 family)